MAGPSARSGAATGGRSEEVAALMEPAELRAALRLAREQPRFCAVALTKERQAVVLLDKRVKPRKLATKLKADARAARIELDPSTIRFGRAAVDGASDNGRVVFTVQKDAPASMQRAMLPVLRPVGYQRCEFVTDAQLEAEPEDDDAGSAPAAVADHAPDKKAPDEKAPDQAAPDGTAPARLPVSAVVPPELAQAVGAALAADPSRRPEFVRLLAQARAGVETGDPEAAEAGRAALRRAVAPTGAADTGVKETGVKESGAKETGAKGIGVTPAPGRPVDPSEIHRYLPALLADIRAIKPGGDTLPLHQRIEQLFGDDVGKRGYLHSLVQDLANPRARSDRDRSPTSDMEQHFAESELISPEQASRRIVDRDERLRQALELAARKLPPAIGASLLELAQPDNLSLVFGAALFFAILQAQPSGPIIDGILLAGLLIGTGLTVKELLEAGAHVSEFFRLVESSDAGVDAAADELVAAVNLITVNVLVAIVLHETMGGGKPSSGSPPVGGPQLATAGGPALAAQAEARSGAAAAAGPQVGGASAVLMTQGRGEAPDRAGGTASRPPDREATPPASEPPPPRPPARETRLRPEQQREIAGIETGNPQEAEFVTGLAEQGAKRDEVLRQFDKLRRGGFQPGDRNEGLREALQTDSNRARNAAFKADRKVQSALAAHKITREQLQAHHIIPMQVVRDFPNVFGPAADAGWRPDAADNLILLPTRAAARDGLARRPNGVNRPLHDNPHPAWNETAGSEVEKFQRQLSKQFERGTSEYERAAKDMLDALTKRMRHELPPGRVSLLDEHGTEYS